MSGQIHAFFDYDGTLIEGDSILFWLRYYYRNRPFMRIFQLLGLPALILRLMGLISSHTYKRFMLWPMSFEHPRLLDQLACDFVIEDLAFRFHRPVLDKLWEHDQQGDTVVVISASANFYLKHLHYLLPLDALILGTEMQWKKGFWGLPRYRDGNLRGENKITRLKQMGFGHAGRGAHGYSDHHHDLPLLKFVEFPVCVRPTPRLRKAALASGWPIWDWPGKRSAWRLKLESLRLLLFSV